MSIFGKLDAATIPTNPNHIDDGEYPAEVTKAEFKVNQEGRRQIFLKYTIDDEESRFNKRSVNQFFNLVDENLTEEDFILLPPKEQDEILKTLSTLKRVLCGNEANARQKGLGVNPDDLEADDWDPSVLVGTKVTIAVRTNKQYVNLQWANLREE